MHILLILILLWLVVRFFGRSILTVVLWLVLVGLIAEFVEALFHLSPKHSQSARRRAGPP